MHNEDKRAASQRAVNVLLTSPFDEDHLQLRTIFRHSNWHPHGARTRAEALEFLQETSAPVVICECELQDGTWKDMLSQLVLLQRPPLLVVTSRFADERLWSEVLNLGAYNVLAKPLNGKEVFHVVSLASLLWNRQWEQPRELALTA